MNNQELSKQIQKLRALFDRTENASGGDIEIQSHWAKYLCVLSAGFLENALYEIYGDFCKRAASEHVANFANSSLSRIQNPKTNRFIEIASSFKKSWGEDLEAFSDEDGRKDAIDSIMTNRHLIAHGKISNISVAQLKEYLDKAIEIVDFIENQLKRGAVKKIS